MAIAAVAVPGDVEAAWVIELTGGMREACAEYGLALVGGDTNRAELIVVSVAVVGAGQMGNGIAHVFAHAEWDVLLVDVAAPALEKAAQPRVQGVAVEPRVAGEPARRALPAAEAEPGAETDQDHRRQQIDHVARINRRAGQEEQPDHDEDHRRDERRLRAKSQVELPSEAERHRRHDQGQRQVGKADLERVDEALGALERGLGAPTAPAHLGRHARLQRLGYGRRHAQLRRSELRHAHVSRRHVQQRAERRHVHELHGLRR